MDGRDLKIVGIYHCGSVLLDVAIVVDIGQVRNLIRLAPDSVCSFYVEPQEGVSQNQLIKEIRTLLRKERWSPGATPESALGSVMINGLIPNGASLGTMGTQIWNSVDQQKPQGGKAEETAGDPFDVRGHEQWAEGLDQFSADLDLFLFLMTSLGVTIAVLSILNTMLMSVSERFVEFGILKANGWTSGEIAWLITLESGLLGLAGGILGAILGWGATHLVNAIWPSRLQLYASVSLLLFSMGFSILLGVAGGLYPTLRAARLSPMDAIRNT
ncbi:MAG: ABC transporter permease [Planctomycetales bacterium]